MSVIHRIKVPATSRIPDVDSDLGVWECCADEVHSFYEPMVSLTVEIDADHTLHMFCEADQVEAAVAVLRSRLGGEPEVNSDSESSPAQQVHAELRDAMYASASKHKITGFEAAGAMFLLASEISATALVRDGLLEGGPDFVDDPEAQS